MFFFVVFCCPQISLAGKQKT